VRRILRTIVTCATIGALGVGSAWAGASLAPDLGALDASALSDLARPG